MGSHALPPVKEGTEKRPSTSFSSSFVIAAYLKYAARLRISDVSYLGIFEYPE
jgi:hypothetical protein